MSPTLAGAPGALTVRFGQDTGTEGDREPVDRVCEAVVDTDPQTRTSAKSLASLTLKSVFRHLGEYQSWGAI